MTNEEATKSYVQYLVSWITNRCDLEFNDATEYELIRLIYDAAQSFMEEHKIYD